MARLYANENFPLPVVEMLRRLGHEVVTSEEAGDANQQIPDSEVLRRATEQGRAVVTINRRDFIRLHRESTAHTGIIVCTMNTDFAAQAAKIHALLRTIPSLEGQLLRVNRGG